jgi:hypothetical protein
MLILCSKKIYFFNVEDDRPHINNYVSAGLHFTLFAWQAATP